MGWVLDADIRGYFDDIDYEWLNVPPLEGIPLAQLTSGAEAGETLQVDREEKMRRNRVAMLIGAHIFLVLAVSASGLNASAETAARNRANSFTDPFNGTGINLPPGGGEPGHAYMEFIKAASNKDYERFCRLRGVEAPDLAFCVENKETLDKFMERLMPAKSHRVVSGFRKGKYAILNVEYRYKGAPESSGPVLISTHGHDRWLIVSNDERFIASQSATINAEAEASSRAGGLPVVEYTGPAAGKWAFEGNDNKGHVWKGSLTISVREGEHLCVMSMQVVPDGEGRGIDGTCKWSPDKRELSFGRKLATFTAILSADGKGMTNGTWTESEENEKTRKATVKRTGTWSATYTGGQANQ